MITYDSDRRSDTSRTARGLAGVVAFTLMCVAPLAAQASLLGQQVNGSLAVSDR